MKVDFYDSTGKEKEVEYSFLDGKFHGDIVYQVMVARLSHEREGNVSTKTKSEVRGGGKKPWRQKGLGRARAGSIRSPLWKGGGVIFGPKPRDFSKGINRKQNRVAILSVLNKMAEMKRLKVIEDFEFKGNKTKDFVKAMDKYRESTRENIVFITADYNKALVLASRNLKEYKVLSAGMIDILPLIYADKILITKKAMDQIGTLLSK